MKEEIQATDTYLATRCIMARFATMTCQERTHLLYVRGPILSFCRSVLYIIHTDSHTYLDFVEQLMSWGKCKLVESLCMTSEQS